MERRRSWRTHYQRPGVRRQSDDTDASEISSNVQQTSPSIHRRGSKKEESVQKRFTTSRNEHSAGLAYKRDHFLSTKQSLYYRNAFIQSAQYTNKHEAEDTFWCCRIFLPVFFEFTLQTNVLLFKNSSLPATLKSTAKLLPLFSHYSYTLPPLTHNRACLSHVLLSAFCVFLCNDYKFNVFLA